MVVLADLLCAIHPEDDLVGKPVGDEVHGGSHEEGEDHTGLAADGAAHHHHHDGQQGEKKGCLESVHCIYLRR